MRGLCSKKKLIVMINDKLIQLTAINLFVKFYFKLLVNTQDGRKGSKLNKKTIANYRPLVLLSLKLW